MKLDSTHYLPDILDLVFCQHNSINGILICVSKYEPEYLKNISEEIEDVYKRHSNETVNYINVLDHNFEKSINNPGLNIYTVSGQPDDRENIFYLRKGLRINRCKDDIQYRNSQGLKSIFIIDGKLMPMKLDASGEHIVEYYMTNATLLVNSCPMVLTQSVEKSGQFTVFKFRDRKQGARREPRDKRRGIASRDPSIGYRG